MTMLSGSIMKGVAVVLAPLSADLRSAIGKNSSTLSTDRMEASTGRADSGGLDDSDDLC